MKTCHKCKTQKDDSDFYRNTNGCLRSMCKVCFREYQKHYRSLELSRIYHANNRKKNNRRSLLYYYENSKAILAKRREKRQARRQGEQQ